jgi:hypothetical protein
VRFRNAQRLRIRLRHTASRTTPPAGTGSLILGMVIGVITATAVRRPPIQSPTTTGMATGRRDPRGTARYGRSLPRGRPRAAADDRQVAGEPMNPATREEAFVLSSRAGETENGHRSRGRRE